MDVDEGVGATGIDKCAGVLNIVADNGDPVSASPRVHEGVGDVLGLVLEEVGGDLEELVFKNIPGELVDVDLTGDSGGRSPRSPNVKGGRWSRSWCR